MPPAHAEVRLGGKNVERRMIEKPFRGTKIISIMDSLSMIVGQKCKGDVKRG